MGSASAELSMRHLKDPNFGRIPEIPNEVRLQLGVPYGWISCCRKCGVSVAMENDTRVYFTVFYCSLGFTYVDF